MEGRKRYDEHRYDVHNNPITKFLFPIFQREHIEGHLEIILRDYEEVSEEASKSPENRALLERTANGAYYKNRGWFYVSKFMDSYDQGKVIIAATVAAFTATVSGPVGPEVTGKISEGLDLIPKIGFSIAYGLSKKDYWGAIGWISAEFLSWIGPQPYSSAIDLANMYIGRVRSNFRHEVANKYLKKLEARKKADDFNFDKGNTFAVEYEVIDPKRLTSSNE